MDSCSEDLTFRERLILLDPSESIPIICELPAWPAPLDIQLDKIGFGSHWIYNEMITSERTGVPCQHKFSVECKVWTQHSHSTLSEAKKERKKPCSVCVSLFSFPPFACLFIQVLSNLSSDIHPIQVERCSRGFSSAVLPPIWISFVKHDCT